MYIHDNKKYLHNGGMKRDLKESKGKKQAAREGRREKFEVKTECIRRLG